MVRKVLKEYLDRNVVYLRDYLMQSDESKKINLAHEYPYFFQDFLDEEQYDFEHPQEEFPSDYEDEPTELRNKFEDDWELVNWLYLNDRTTFDAFSDYLFKKISSHEIGIPDSEFPAWTYFDSNPKMVKNQWLIHFTDDANGIRRDGFKYGVDDMTKLGLTTSIGEFQKKFGGYNFAYLLKDFEKYAYKGYGKYKYGSEVVVFQASGILTWHSGDEEPQVIFYGNTAKNIIPITSGEDKNWAIRNWKTDRILFESDELESVVQWLVKNFAQYRTIL